jgi:hypothetical protein
VDQMAQNGFKVAEISADKVYIGATNLLTSLQQGAILYIPFKINA